MKKKNVHKSLSNNICSVYRENVNAHKSKLVLSFFVVSRQNKTYRNGPASHQRIFPLWVKSGMDRVKCLSIFYCVSVDKYYTRIGIYWCYRYYRCVL